MVTILIAATCITNCATPDAIPERNPDMLASLSGFLLGECSDNDKHKVCIIGIGNESQVHMVAPSDECKTTAPSLSANQEQIVFAQVLPEKALWLADKEGNNLQRLITSTDELFMSPYWDRDGNQIAYLRATNPFTPTGDNLPTYSHTMLDIVSMVKVEPRTLTLLAGDVIDFAWSPDGKQILTSARLEDYNQDSQVNSLDPIRLYLITLANQNIQPMANRTSPELATEKPGWSPDGNYISYIAQWELVVVDIYQNREVARLEIGANGYYRWSPSGSKLAYVGNSTPSLEKSYDDIFIFDLVSNTSVQVTNTETYTPFSNFHDYGVHLSDLVWAPDEKYLAFVWYWMEKEYVAIASVDSSQITLVSGPMLDYSLSAWAK